jgi:uncharacterized RDD family membrane protein YckC
VLEHAVRPANPVRRLVATLADGLLFLGGFLVAWSAGTPARSTTLRVVLAALAVLYQAAFIGRFGWTPGYRVFGLRVVRVDGTRPGYARPLVRALALQALGAARIIWPVAFVAEFWYFVDRRRRQSLYDKLVGLLVVEPAFA